MGLIRSLPGTLGQDPAVLIGISALFWGGENPSKTEVIWVPGIYIYIWVFPKIGNIPKWMVKIMENPIKIDEIFLAYKWG